MTRNPSELHLAQALCVKASFAPAPQDNLAERSKAVAQNAIPEKRGLEPQVVNWHLSARFTHLGLLTVVAVNHAPFWADGGLSIWLPRVIANAAASFDACFERAVDEPTAPSTSSPAPCAV